MSFYVILRILLFFQICFFIKCDEKINILDNDIKIYFDSSWVAGTNTEDIILVKMEKENSALDDYNSTFFCERNFKYKGVNYKLKIKVSPNHNLTYEIFKDNKPITDVEKEIFYRDPEDYDDEGNPVQFYKTTKSLFYSKNWVLLKLKTKYGNEFYSFINNIYPITTNETWMPLGYFSKFSDVYIIYSNISSLPFIAASRVSVQHKSIDLTGLNFENNDSVTMHGWFSNCKNLKTFKNFPKFIKEINMSRMLDGCESLEEISLSGKIIVSAGSCFLGCNNLKNIDLTNTHINENAILNLMFKDCKSIEKIVGIEKLVKKNDKPDVYYMFDSSNIKGKLDLSQWGTNIIPKGMFSNANVKDLTLFDLRNIKKYVEEIIRNNKKKIEEYNKKISEYNIEINKKKKELEDLNKQPGTEENKNKKTVLTAEINGLTISVKKIERQIKKIEDKNKDIESLDILEGAVVENLYIKDEFMPEDKKDLDKLIGKNCTVKMLYIVDKDGNCKKYKGINDYKNNIEYKEQKQDLDHINHQIQENHINQQNPKDIKEKHEEVPKCSKCLDCCTKCFHNCCCCCNNGSNRKRSNSI